MRKKLLTILFGSAAAVLVVVATSALRRGSSEAGETGRLEPLKPLVGGVWYEQAREGDEAPLRKMTFEWGLDGEMIRARQFEQKTNKAVLEMLLFFHPRKNELGFTSVEAGDVREGILRAGEDGIELRYHEFRDDGGAGNYREHLRFTGPDRLRRTVHRVTETKEILDHEVVFVRKKR